MAQDASVNSDAGSSMSVVGGSVARTQVKYHRWAVNDRVMRFGDLFNLVCHPDYLSRAFEHVARNKGARTAGIDGVTVRQIREGGQLEVFLAQVAANLRDGTYRPAPVRRVMIPKPGGKSRPLGIPTVTDRVVQQSLRMVNATGFPLAVEAFEGNKAETATMLPTFMTAHRLTDITVVADAVHRLFNIMKG